LITCLFIKNMACF